MRRFQRMLPMSLVGALVLGWGPRRTDAEDRSWKEIDSRLGTLWDEKQFADIIAMSQEALRVAEQTFGPNDPRIASLINSLAHAYRASALDAMDRYAKTESWYRRAIAILEHANGPNHPDVAATLNNLAELYATHGRYMEAEPLYQRALSLWERVGDPEDPHLAITLNNLATMYKAQGRYAEADRTYRKALELLTAASFTPQPIFEMLSKNLNALAASANSSEHDARSGQGSVPAPGEDASASAHAPPQQAISEQHAELEATYRWKLSALEETVGPDHPAVATVLTGLAGLYVAQKRYEEAEPLYRRVVRIIERDKSDDVERKLATAFSSLLELYTAQARWQEAKPLYKRLLVVLERLRGPEHSDLIPVLEGYAKSLEVTGHDAKEIKMIRKRIEQIQKTFVSH